MGQKIRFPGEADELPGMEIGDVVVVLDQKSHDVFQRQDSDLAIIKKISLCEALCGVDFVVEHLDERVIRVRSSPGEVIKDGDVRSIMGEGMPRFGSPFERGNLHVKFEVEMPAPGSLSEDQIHLLRSILPGPLQKPMNLDGDVENVFLGNFQRSSASRSASSAYDSDEDDGSGGMGGQRVGCATH